MNLETVITPSASADFSVVGVPAFRDNYIWVLVRGSDAIVVDPGDATPVLAYLAEHRLKLHAIWLTHHHADHIGGLNTLLDNAPETPVFGPAAESITGVNHPLSGGESIRLFGLDWSVLSLPGHTRGHLGYFAAGRLFCGDVLFGLGCGRLFEGTARQMYGALSSIAALPADTAVYCAHEYIELNLPFALHVDPDNPDLQRRVEQIERQRAADEPTVPMTLADELATNPFLRCHQPALAAAAQREDSSIDASDPQAVFAVLREWRNRF